MAVLVLVGATLAAPLAPAPDPGDPPARVLISEILPAPAPGTAEVSGEWVELIALMGGALEGIALTDSDGEVDFTFPPATIAAGERVVVANGVARPPAIPTSVRVFQANKSWWTFDNEGDDLTLLSAGGEAIDHLWFGSGPAVDGAASAPLDSRTGAPTAGMAVGRGPNGAALLIPTPGEPNREVGRAASALLTFVGVLQSDSLVGVVLCSGATAPHSLFGWTMEVNGSLLRLEDAQLSVDRCLYVGREVGKPSLWQVAQAFGLPSLEPQLIDLPEERGPTSVTVHDWEGTLALAQAVLIPPRTGRSALTALRPCDCPGGWQAIVIGPLPAVSPPRGAVSARIVAAGPELSGALLAVLENATATIEINSYLLTSQTFADALRAAAERDVFVRLLLEPSPVGVPANATALSPSSLSAFGDSGVWARAFEKGPQRPARDHAKYLIADAQTVVVSTENFVGAALGSSELNTGYAALIESEGLAADLLALFEWDFADGHDLTLPRPARPPHGPPRAIANSSNASLLVSPFAQSALSAWVGAVDHTRAHVQIESLSADEQVIGPSSALGAALLRAATRGVKVEILLSSSGPSSDGDGSNEATARALLAALVPPANLSVRIDPREVSGPSRMHAKVLVADGGIAIVGSHNLVAAAFESNREVSVLLDDPGAVGALSLALADDFAKGVSVRAAAVALEDGSRVGVAGNDASQAIGPLPTFPLLLGFGVAATLVAYLGPLLGRVPGRGRRVRRRQRKDSKGRSDEPEIVLRLEPQPPHVLLPAPAAGPPAPVPEAPGATARAQGAEAFPPTAFDLLARD